MCIVKYIYATPVQLTICVHCYNSFQQIYVTIQIEIRKQLWDIGSWRPLYSGDDDITLTKWGLT